MPWHPFRHPGLCGLRGTTCFLLLISFVIVIPILWFYEHTPSQLNPNATSTPTAPSLHSATVPSPDSPQFLPRYAGPHAKRSTSMPNIQFWSGQTQSIKIDLCSVVPCVGNQAAYQWSDKYVCVRPVTRGWGHKCEDWKWVFANTSPTSYGTTPFLAQKYGLINRFSIIKGSPPHHCSPNQCNPLIITIKSPSVHDSGIYVLGANMPHSDPLGYFKITVLLNTSTVQPVQPLSPANTSPLYTQVIKLGDLTYTHISDPREHHEFASNLWYKTIRSWVHASSSNTSCYACTLFPHTTSSALPISPRPLTQNEWYCSLLSMTNLTYTATGWPVTPTLSEPCTAYSNLRVRFSSGHNLTATSTDFLRPVATLQPSSVTDLTHLLCVTRSRTVGSIFLGHTSGCLATAKNTCGYPFPTHKKSPCLLPNSPFVYSPSLFPNSTSLPPKFLTWPSDCGFGSPYSALWLCDHSLFQGLPPNWSGTCALVDIKPQVMILSELFHTTHHYPHYRRPSPSHVAKRSATVMISPADKFGSGLFPWYGTVNNAHHIDKLHIRLENLTSLFTESLNTLSPFVIATRNMLMQHNMALDVILASVGGLCHVIGPHCCTYIPDISGNLSDTITHLNDLLSDMKKDDKTVPDGWDFWSWLTDGGWKAWLTRIGYILLIVVLILCSLSCLIVPLCRKLVTSLFNLQLARMSMQLVHLYANTSQDEDDPALPLPLAHLCDLYDDDDTSV